MRFWLAVLLLAAFAGWVDSSSRLAPVFSYSSAGLRTAFSTAELLSHEAEEPFNNTCGCSQGWRLIAPPEANTVNSVARAVLLSAAR